MSAGRGRALGPPPLLLVLVLVLVLVLPPGAGLEVSNVCAACHVHATCHQIEGKSACICNYGFVGNGRTHCQDKDECQIGASKICGNHTLCHNTYGSFYCVCLDGFRASNNNKTFIPNDGTNCTDIDECEEPGLCGYNARCVNTEGSYECYCNDGYKLENGERSFHPNASSTLCKEIRCGSPPEMKHGYIVGNYSLVPGSTVHYECEEGFYSSEGKSSYCTADRAWEPATLSCKGVDCGVPPSILNARQASLSGTTYGSEVTYNCVHGYFIASGNQTAACNAKGQWDGADLVCKEIDCGKPLLIPHTEIFWDNSTTLLSRVFYKCKEGYYFNGERNFSECTLDQKWERITYICKKEELFSNLTVFNETCVKWQMRTGRLGVQKIYTFHILGRRWDEKTFSEDAILNVTTSEDNPKVCLDLNSGSNYVVNITTISSTNIPVSVTVAVQTKVKEAFNNVLIFNDTCLKWRRNVRGADMEDRYLFHVQGQRWYQKEFLHEMTFNLTTREQAPEVCFDLQPGTNYSINISMVALNFSLLVSMTTQITGYTCSLQTLDNPGYTCSLQTLECASPHTSCECVHQKVDSQAGRKWSELKERISSQAEYSVLESSALHLVDPPFPDIEFVAAKGSAPLLRLRKAEDRNGPISLYQVIVLPLGLQSTFVCDSFATATFFSNTTDAKGYVAAEFRAKDVADNMPVALGDRHYYGKFYNAPLKLGKEYCVFLRIISEWNKVRTQSCAVWAQIKNSSPTLWYMTAVVLGSVAAVCLILFLSFLAARSYLYRTVHSPPAALACEGVRLSATMDTARASSLLETENVSLL